MPIYSGDIETAPEGQDIGSLGHTSLGTMIGQTARSALSEGPTAKLLDMGELSAASGQVPDFGGPIPPELSELFTKQPEIDMAAAKARVKEESLDSVVHLPDQPTMKAGALDIMINRARASQERDAKIAAGPTGFISGAFDVGTSLMVSAVDPLNVAVGFIPVLGEARYGKMLASAGENAFLRAGVRAGAGAFQGAAFSTAMAPLDWAHNTQEGRDYTMADALHSILYGAGTFGLMHVAGGTGADIYRSIRGRPLYPFGPGEPMERGTNDGRTAEAPGGAAPAGGASGPAESIGAEAPDAGATPREGDEPGTGAVATGEARTDGASDEPLNWPLSAGPHITPQDIWPGLPPRVNEDLMRGSLAAMIEGESVNAGEMLAAGARHDPKIAEAIEAWHGSPHDFERFDISHVGAGEGAQAYGHGVYLAENPAVAKEYALMRPMFGGKEYSSQDPLHVAALAVHDAGSKKAALESLTKQLAGMDERDGGYFVAVQRAITALKNDRPLPAIEGNNLYRVRLPTDKVRFLDWDKVLTPEQREAFARLLPERAAYFRDPNSSPSGQSAYEELTGGIHRNAAVASERLRAAGIPGIKYLDQGSRGPDALYDVGSPRSGFGPYSHFQNRADAEKQLELLRGHGFEDAEIKETKQPKSHNFVVFDDKSIEITHKNGEPVKREDPAAQAKKPAFGPAARDPKTWSLFEFLAERGGLHPEDQAARDVAGRVKSLGAGQEIAPGGMTGELTHILDGNPTVFGFGKLLRKTGYSLDRAREAAEEAGYLPHGSTIRALLDKLRDEAGGQKQYIPGNEPAVKPDRSEELHFIERELDNALREVEIDPQTLPDIVRARVLELMDKERVTDPLEAYERAVMERTHHGADQGQHERGREFIPGWDVPDDARAAPRTGGDAAPIEVAGRPDAGTAARAIGQGDRTSPTPAQDWRALADRTPFYEQPEVLEASAAAAKLPEPESLSFDPNKRIAAAQRAAAEAEAEYKLSEPYLPQDIKDAVEHQIALIHLEDVDRAEVIRRGAACLASVAAGAL